MLPSVSDFSPALAAGRAHYEELLDAGVVIYERQRAWLHAKTAVIDGVWSTVGSTNLDRRSFLFNQEVNTVVLGSNFHHAREQQRGGATDRRGGIRSDGSDDARVESFVRRRRKRERRGNQGGDSFVNTSRAAAED